MHALLLRVHRWAARACADSRRPWRCGIMHSTARCSTAGERQADRHRWCRSSRIFAWHSAHPAAASSIRGGRPRSARGHATWQPAACPDLSFETREDRTRGVWLRERRRAVVARRARTSSNCTQAIVGIGGRGARHAAEEAAGAGRSGAGDGPTGEWSVGAHAHCCWLPRSAAACKTTRRREGHHIMACDDPATLAGSRRGCVVAKRDLSGGEAESTG